MEKEDDIRLGKLIDVPYRKNYIGGILQVYFKYTSFILQILEVHLSDLPRKSINEV